MKLFPAIDLIGGEAVRLFKGDYAKKTVYSTCPLDVAKGFYAAGARYIHLVDLEGARDGTTPNFQVVQEIIEQSGLKAEIGGGIRNAEVVKKYLDAGAFRVILGTAAIENPAFLKEMVSAYGEKIAVGVDLKNGMVATHGWTESTGKPGAEFIEELVQIGVKTVICTDISKDGAMAGTNLELYRSLHEQFPQLDLVASGGVSDIENVKALLDMDIPSAILGKALYEGKLDLGQAVALCGQEAQVC